MKKQIWFLLGGAVIVAALVAIAWFLLATPAPAAENVDPSGVWKVCKADGEVAGDEYMIFDGGKLTALRAGEAYFEGLYEVTGDTVSVPELAKQYTASLLSERQMVLRGGSHYELMRIDGIGAFPENLAGEWQVVMQAGKPVLQERVVFEGDTLRDLRGGKEYLASAYTYQNGVITVEQMNAEFEAYTCGQALMLFEKNGGYVWELEVA